MASSRPTASQPTARQPMSSQPTASPRTSSRPTASRPTASPHTSSRPTASSLQPSRRRQAAWAQARRSRWRPLEAWPWAAWLLSGSRRPAASRVSAMRWAMRARRWSMREVRRLSGPATLVALPGTGPAAQRRTSGALWRTPWEMRSRRSRTSSEVRPRGRRRSPEAHQQHDRRLYRTTSASTSCRPDAAGLLATFVQEHEHSCIAWWYCPVFRVHKLRRWLVSLRVPTEQDLGT
mmetsp:Transcript_99407/g.301756  ORF Transcript_99407/g.301756 Transcript_99407/m.301756 type:complete len:235 (-) Transcript_99407:26-730(-)